ncbi:MAG: UDP-N-acetylmuramoyl-L-alanyl-D-glutamate--2,6-diaminopimelate ligase [Anaerolineales bacterium]
MSDLKDEALGEKWVKLSDLFGRIPIQALGAVPQVSVNGIALDSRQVQPGNLFVALSGGTTDGHRFIPDAIRRGAVAVVGTQALGDLPVPYVQVPNGRQALALLSAAFYDFPGRKLTVIGVTGTDGKTTTTNLIHSILTTAGIQAGMISTVNAVIGGQLLDTGFHVTTPEAPDVQRYLARMVTAGLTHVVLEATSHGLDQRRVGGCEFDVAVVTNITHEHLDYHGSQEAYRAAKGRLFSMMASRLEKTFQAPHGAVLNLDDSSFAYLSALLDRIEPAQPVQRISYGVDREAQVRAAGIQNRPEGLYFTALGTTAEGSPYRLPVSTRLVGSYNVSNCLAAIAATVNLLGLEPQSAQQGIANLAGIPGRMERIDMGQDFTAIVDFAHTPNALRRALGAAREIAGKRRVLAVFGSAGLRDRQKRRLMAEVSAELADRTILTAEDPRSESLPTILEEMAAGAASRNAEEFTSFWRVPDRGRAIRMAVGMAQPGDVVIACGKGHEQSMCFGETEYLWDDRTAMRAALADLLGIPGPDMPYLPTQEEKEE